MDEMSIPSLEPFSGGDEMGGFQTADLFGMGQLPKIGFEKTDIRGKNLEVITNQPISRSPENPIDPKGIYRPDVPRGKGFDWLRNCLCCFKSLYDSCCFQLDCRSRLTLYESISRHEEEFTLSVEYFRENVTKDDYLIAILNGLYIAFPDFFFKYIPTGSLREGFGKVIPGTSILATDYDIMLVPDEVYVGKSTSENKPLFTVIKPPQKYLAGNVWLKLEETYLKQWEDICIRRYVNNNGVSLLSSIKWREELRKAMINIATLVTTTQDRFNVAEDNITLSVYNNGPALTVDITGVIGQGKTFVIVKGIKTLICPGTIQKVRFFYTNFTLGLHCEFWPEEAEGFFNSEFRENWPPKEAIELIKKLGCHVVPKSPTDHLIEFSEQTEDCTAYGQTPGLEWRYSFSQPEIILSKYIPQAAKTAFLGLKALIKNHFNSYGKISSFSLKCIMFRVVERKPQQFWNNDENMKETVETVFMEMLMMLKDCLENGKCENYWIPEVNIFEDLTKIELDSKLSLIVLVIANPGKYLTDDWLEYMRCVRMNCCYCFRGCPNLCPTLECPKIRIPCTYFDDKFLDKRYGYDPVSLDVY